MWTRGILLDRRVSVHRRNVLPVQHIMALTALMGTHEFGRPVMLLRCVAKSKNVSVMKVHSSQEKLFCDIYEPYVMVEQT